MYFLTSCTEKQNTNKVDSLENIIVNTLEKKLMLPDGLSMYKPFTNYNRDSAEIFNSKLKIYSFVDASCPTCIENIQLWSNLIPELSKYNVPVILILGSKDQFELIKYICESDEIDSFPFPWFFDNKNKYLKLNEFMKQNINFQTVLTNRNNKILLLGNPIRSKEIKELYLNEIKKRIKPSGN